MKRHNAHRVYVKRLWADAWVEVEGLYCDWFKLACSPDVNEAQLSWTFGRVMPPGETEFTNRFTLGYEGYYVRIELDQTPNGEIPWSVATYTPIRWYGVIVDSSQERGGIGEIGVTFGVQKLICRGLEYLLQRTTVDSSFVKTATGEAEIGRAIAFNLGSGQDSDHTRKDNRSTVAGDGGSYIFAASLDEADCQPWYADEIAEYLLVYHPPRDRNGDVKISFQLDPGFSASVLHKFSPTIQAHGKTVKEALDELIDRRRGIAWYVAVNVTEAGGVVINETPQIVAVTFNKDALVLPSGALIPPNPDQTAWLFDDLATIKSHSLTSDTATQFDRVIARGERLGACFTVSYSTTLLEKDWTDALETAYNAGASGDAGYAALEDYEKASANQQFRADDKFRKVYRYFRVPPTWDGHRGADVVCPNPDAGGAVSEFWYPGLRFKDVLPLLTERDYADVEAVTSEEVAKSKPEFRRPFALIYDTDATRWYALDRMAMGGAPGENLPTSAGREYSAHIRMQDDAFGIIIDVAGRPQHAIAATDFTAADAVDEADYEADLPWQEIAATVFAEFDQHVQEKWPPWIPATDADAIKELIIDCPNMRLDYLTPGTFLGIDEAGAVNTCDAGGYVIDDRELLKDIARSAYQWYGQTRQALSVVRHFLTPDVSLGTLVTFVGDAADPEEVNSVVTQQTFDLLAGTVATQTQFAQLDLRGVT